LGGRDAGRLEALAARFSLEYRVCPLSDPDAFRRGLEDVAAILLVAGPFSQTSAPVVDACLRTGTHYLDLTGECSVLVALSHRSDEAKLRGCMVMPGCGFDVVPSDCLASHVSRRLPGALHLAIGVSGLVTATRGSLRTIAEHAGQAVLTRRNGE